MGPKWGPSGSCRPQMGPMLAPWTLLSGSALLALCEWTGGFHSQKASNTESVNKSWRHHVEGDTWIRRLMTVSVAPIPQIQAINTSLKNEHFCQIIKKLRGKFQDFVMLSQEQRRYFRNMFLKFGNTWRAWIMSNILSGYLGKSSYSTVGYLQSPNGADVCGVRYVIGRQSPRLVCYCDSVMSHRCHLLTHVICDAAMIWQWLFSCHHVFSTPRHRR